MNFAALIVLLLNGQCTINIIFFTWLLATTGESKPFLPVKVPLGVGTQCDIGVGTKVPLELGHKVQFEWFLGWLGASSTLITILLNIE